MPSNSDLLTRSHAAIAAKRNDKRNQVKEVLFDDNARREYLTGFHKRKLAKADAARKKAIEREKKARQESRREQRQMLREQAVQNAAEVEQAYGAIVYPENDEEWEGTSSPEKGKQKMTEAEYEDEEILATVAVVEDFDPDAILHGPNPPSTHAPPALKVSKPSTTPSKAKLLTSTKSKLKPRKPSSIKYETKSERLAAKSKQRKKRSDRAETRREGEKGAVVGRRSHSKAKSAKPRRK